MEAIIISNTVTAILAVFIAVQFGPDLGRACDELCNRLLDELD